jgi:hypothetical protein
VNVDTAGSNLYGRDAVVRELIESDARLTVLTGEPGIGRSAVLRAAQAQTTNAIAPPPRTLPRLGGVLYRNLLGGLGDVLVEDIQKQGDDRRADRRLKEAVEIASGAIKHEFLRIISRELLAVVRGRLGPTFGEATAKFVNELKEGVAQRLDARLAQGPSEAELVATLAHEVLERLEVGAAVLAFDDCQHLRPEELLNLDGLVDLLPERLTIRVAFWPCSEAHSSALTQMVDEDRICERPLKGIEPSGVRSWLEARGLDGKAAKRVHRVTGGNALHLVDVIARLEQGGAIHDSMREDLAHRTDEAWMQLAPEVARHARRLCVCADPLPFDRTLDFLGLEAAEWGEAQERLQTARIFSVEVEGLPWFQEARRTYLSERKLGGEERKLLVANAQQWFDSELNELFEGSSYSAWYALEKPVFQTLLTGWIHLMASVDPLRAAQGLARFYLKALWWWGLYVPFDLCDRLVEIGARMGSTTGDTEDASALRDAIEQLHRCYPREGLRFRDERSIAGAENGSWSEAYAALERIAGGAGVLGGDETGDGEGAPTPAIERELPMLVHVFMAHCLRGMGAESGGIDDEQLAQILGHYKRAIALAGDDFEWDLPWFECERADTLAERAASPRTAQDAEREVWREQARAQLRAAYTYVEDHRDEGVENLDFELAANVKRVEGDLLWDCGHHGQAIDQYGLAVHYAHAQQVWLPQVGPDAYTRTFYCEQRLRLANRIAELAAREGEPAHGSDALSIAVERLAGFRGEDRDGLRERVAACLLCPRELAVVLGDHCPSVADLIGAPKDEYRRSALARIRGIERRHQHDRHLDIVLVPALDGHEDGP